MTKSKRKRLPADCDCGRPAVHAISDGVECAHCWELRLRMCRENEAPRKKAHERGAA